MSVQEINWKPIATYDFLGGGRGRDPLSLPFRSAYVYNVKKLNTWPFSLQNKIFYNKIRGKYLYIVLACPMVFVYGWVCHSLQKFRYNLRTPHQYFKEKADDMTINKMHLIDLFCFSLAENVQNIKVV